MAKRKKSLSSSDDSSSSSSDSSSSSSDSPRQRRNKLKDQNKSNQKSEKRTVKSKSKEKVVQDKRKKSPPRRSPERKRKQSDSVKITTQKSTHSEDSKVEAKKRHKSPERSHTKRHKSPERSHRQRSKKERSKSPKADQKKKNLFPIVSKGDDVTLELELGKKNITETTLVSYPNLNKSVTEDRTKNEDDRKRRHSHNSPERFKSMSSTITVTHNTNNPEAREADKRPRRSPVQRSLRDRVGWDPFQGTNSSSFGDHDDRQLNRGYNDSYTRKEFGRGRARGGGGGRGFRSDNRPRGGGGGGGGGMWSNNRNFSRNDSQENTDRSGINDKKWKRDMFSDD